ncbi:MAG: fasciclin domain-containing protein [Deltaproteobacteria bacterium]|nr:fasciclin domain-containing protein [Deltaproteobacteria bacterium]
MTRSIRYLLLVPTLFGLACDADDGRPSYPSFDQSVLQILESRSDLKAFTALVKRGGLADAFGGTQANFTVFAPTDDAIAAGNLNDTAAEANSRVRYLAVGGKQLLSLVRYQDSLTTIKGTTFQVSLVNDNESTAASEKIVLTDGFGSEATVISGDLQANNGVVHIIDHVLTPPVDEVLEELAQRGGFERFLEAAQRTDAEAALYEAGPFTVVAPNNAAMDAFGDLKEVSDAVVENLVYQHILDGAFQEAELGAVLRTSEAMLPVSFTGTASPAWNLATVGDGVDLAAMNGVGHELDAVIPLPTTFEATKQRPELKKFGEVSETLIPKSKEPFLPDTFGAGEEPVTVFVPSEEAFDTFFGFVPAVENDEPKLATVFANHVVSGQTTLKGLIDGSELYTESGTITVSRDDLGTITITNEKGTSAVVLSGDIRTKNGIIHLIDHVLSSTVAL